MRNPPAVISTEAESEVEGPGLQITNYHLRITTFRVSGFTTHLLTQPAYK